MLLGALCLGATVCILWPVGYLPLTILIYAVPAVWAGWKRRRALVQAFLLSLTVGLPCFFAIDVVGTTNGAWYVPASRFRLLGLVPVEDLVWGIVVLFTSVAVMQAAHSSVRVVRRQRLAVFVLLTLLLSMLLAIAARFNPRVIVFPYAYLAVGGLSVGVPTAALLLARRTLDVHALLPLAYLSILATLFELVGTQQGYWYFSGPGYLGGIEIGGAFIPFEEFAFYLALSGSAAWAYYLFLTKPLTRTPEST